MLVISYIFVLDPSSSKISVSLFTIISQFSSITAIDNNIASRLRHSHVIGAMHITCKTLSHSLLSRHSSLLKSSLQSSFSQSVLSAPGSQTITTSYITIITTTSTINTILPPPWYHPAHRGHHHLDRIPPPPLPLAPKSWVTPPPPTSAPTWERKPDITMGSSCGWPAIRSLLFFFLFRK